MPRLLGSNLFLHAYNEVTWGVKPDSPAYVFLPVETYGVVKSRNRRQSTPYFGNFGRKHSQTHSMMVQGAMGGALYGYVDATANMSLAEYLLRKVFDNPNSNELPSFGAEWAQGPDVANQRHSGLRVNSFTLSGSADSGRWDYNMDLMGKTEVTFATAQTVPNDLHKLIEFDFAGSVLQIAAHVEGEPGVLAPICFENFQLNRTHNLRARYCGATTPTVLDRTTRQTTVSFQLIKESDTYHAAARLLSAQDAEFNAQLVIQGRHGGTGDGDFTVITIDLPRLQLVNPEDAYAIEDHVMTTINMDALKPDTADDEISITYGDDEPEEP